jgi:uncharacterized membrane protein
MQNNLILLGIIFVFLGFILLFIGSLMGAKTGDSKVAVVGLLGPIPFGFGNDKRLFLIALSIAVALMVVWFIAKRF